jgi:ribosomal protein L7Ae-like RNA K-turn-binding protein
VDDAVDILRQRLLALIGLAVRARKLTAGATAVERLVERGGCPLIIVADDAGAALRRRLERLAPTRGQLQAPLSRQELGRACGRATVAVAAIEDPGFARGIRALGLERRTAPTD